MKKIIFPLLLVILVVGAILAYKKQPEITPTPTTTGTPVTFGMHAQAITLKDGTKFDVELPKEYSIKPVYENLGRPRFMAWSPDGRLFVAEIKNLSDNSDGRILILEKGDVFTYLSGLRNPHSIAFYKKWIYVALTDRLVRYEYKAGDTKPSGTAEVIAKFPDYGDHGWHLTRTVVFQGDSLFVSIGSSCNSCEQKDGEIRAQIMQMNPDGSDAHTYAYNLRNAVGMVIADGDLYATDMGVDQLGNNKPNDIVYKIEKHADYGWPWCYQYSGRVYPDTTQAWNTSFDCTKVPKAFGEFPAHSAPLGIEKIDSDFLVALHGSGNIGVGQVPRVVRITRKGIMSDFITGFGTTEKRFARPAGILADKDDKNSFWISDDFGGAIYFVKHQ